MTDQKRAPERAQTDESLATERQEADDALATRQASIESQADVVIAVARDDADVVLAAARELADERVTADKALLDERAHADELVRSERAVADETLRMEREAVTRTLARLLPLEREKTDRYLLTERSRADDAVFHRDDFMGIVSHDLRNLLGAVALTASVLDDKDAVDETEALRVHTATERIERYCARMSRLIGDLVDVVAIDSGKLSLRREEHDLTTAISEAIETFQASARAKSIRLGSGQTAPLIGSFDHERVLQVLANLITNAIKFTPPGGSVEVTAERDDVGLRLAVVDSGCGIPASLQGAVFERFWQRDKNDRRGSGLGLYISRCIVEAHGGTVSVESEPGRGSSFSVRLPA